MSRFLSQLKHNYVQKKVELTRVPHFENSALGREKVIFSGRVQGVGFRYEMERLATRLGLKGWVRNRTDSKVEAEIQGKRTEIRFLVEHMQSLRRATVTDVTITELAVVDGETGFTILP